MATIRGTRNIKKVGLEVRVLTVPQGKDPDEFIRNNGKEAFLKLIDEALPLIDYKIKVIKEGSNFKNTDDVIKYAERALDVIADLDPIEKEIYIKKLSEETKVKEQALFDMLNNKIQKNVKKDENVNIDRDFGQKLYLEPAYLKAERNLLKFMLEDKETFEYVIDNIEKNNLILESHKKIYDYIVENIELDKDEMKNRIESRCNDIEYFKRMG